MKTTGTESAAGKSPRGRLRIAGIQWPDSTSGIDPQAALAALADVTTLDELVSVGSKHAVTVPFPVYQDELGQFFSMHAGVDNSLVATALNLGPLHDLQDGAPGPGSFLNSSTLSAAATLLNGPSVSAAIAAAAAQMILSSQGASPQSGGSAAKADNPLLDKLKSFLESTAEQKAASVVANYVMGNSLTQGLIQNSLSGMAMSALDAGINEAIDFAESEVLSKLFPTSDTSSAGQFLAAEAAKELLDSLKAKLEAQVASWLGVGADNDKSMLDKLNDVLGPPHPGIPLIRTGDCTADGGSVIGGTVLTEVGGVPIARVKDEQMCPVAGPPAHVQGPIIEGNETVLIEKQAAAGENHKALCQGSGSLTLLVASHDDVEIGAGSTVPQSRSRKSILIQAVNTGQSIMSSNPEGGAPPDPGQDGIPWERDADGSYYQVDGHQFDDGRMEWDPDRQMWVNRPYDPSCYEPYEPSLLDKVLGWEDNPRIDENSGKSYPDYSYLWGLIDLGSPQEPGAGTQATWWIPDKLFGYDMSDYTLYHDQNFDSSRDLSELGAILDTEWEAFKRGLSLDPVRDVLQIVYSSATMTVGVSAGVINTL